MFYKFCVGIITICIGLVTLEYIIADEKITTLAIDTNDLVQSNRFGELRHCKRLDTSKMEWECGEWHYPSEE